MEGLEPIGVPFVRPDSPSKLTDDQWAEICRFCNFPSDARPWIESEIDCYHVRSTALSVTAEATRGELSALSKKAELLKDGLEALVKDPRASVALALASEFPGGFAAAMDANLPARTIEGAAPFLDGLAKLLAAAAQRVQPSKPGLRQRAVNIRFMVHQLDRILIQFTGSGISRSRKRQNSTHDFVTTVCRFADPSISASSIDEAMKRVIGARNKISPKTAG
jgi:hypothetical protein